MSFKSRLPLSEPNNESIVTDSGDEATMSLPKQQNEDLAEFMYGSELLTSETGALSRAVVSNLQMPQLQHQQQSMLFYFSLIEGRCKTQAANTLNAGRPPEDHLSQTHSQVGELAEHLFAEMTKELHKAGVLPTEFAGQDFAALRQKYLSSFDNILNNLATRRQDELLANNAHKTIDNNEILFTNDYTVSSFDYSNSSGSTNTSRVHQSRAMAMAQRPDHLGIMVGNNPLQSVPVASHFHGNYRQLSRLGKGGFGCVYKVLDLTDDREYALKKIIVHAARLRLMQARDVEDTLLKELRVLARLDHRNVVRYFVGWVEWRPAHKPSTNSRLLPGEASSSSSDESSDNEEFDGKDLQSDIRRRLDKEADLSRAYVFAEEEYDASILFEDSVSRPPPTNNLPKQPSPLPSNKPTQSMFRKPGERDSDDDESTEEISRALTQIGDFPEYHSVNEDAHIFIKMSVHPMTLEDFIWPDEFDRSKPQIQHCFHPCASARILLAILDGMEYIHSQKIVHRDLKPSNIFLSVRVGPPSLYDGSVDISSCLDCKNEFGQAGYNITPCIGDFGLIAEIKDPVPTDLNAIPNPSISSPAVFQPSPLAVLSSRQPGTKFYCPPSMSGRNSVICEKLDVFSLGVIAFELLVKFATKSERADVLGRVLKGEFPNSLESHGTVEGLKGMLALEREKRWDCKRVREWLGKVLVEYEGLAAK